MHRWDEKNKWYSSHVPVDHQEQDILSTMKGSESLLKQKGWAGVADREEHISAADPIRKKQKRKKKWEMLISRNSNSSRPRRKLNTENVKQLQEL